MNEVTVIPFLIHLKYFPSLKSVQGSQTLSNVLVICWTNEKNEKQKHIDKKCLLKKKIKLKDKNGWEAQHTELRIKKTSYILP